MPCPRARFTGTHFVAFLALFSAAAGGPRRTSAGAAPTASVITRKLSAQAGGKSVPPRVVIS